MSEAPIARYRDLSGRTVLISGGASGIGADMVRAFHHQGAAVAFTDIAAEAGEALVAELSASAGPTPLFIVSDVTDPEQLAAAVMRAERVGGGLDALINNAADDTRHKVGEIAAADWDSGVAVNLRHQFLAARDAAALMAARGRGSIVNFGSVAPALKIADLSVYSTCKAAVRGLTRSLAREFGARGVRVNAIVPGAVLTERQRRLWISAEDETRLMREQCLPRPLNGRDVAEMALFLASDASAGCTAQEFVVDAGIT